MMDPQNNTPTDENAGQTPTKKSQSEKYGTSCVVCRAAHTYCDLQRPCGRCVQRGAPEACQDAPKKQRGRPPGKRNRIVDVSPNAPPLAGGLSIKKEAMPTIENSQVETTVKMWQALKNGTITATLDESCCFITASDEFCQSFGYELGDLIGSKWRNFVPDGTAEEYHNTFKSKCVNTSGSNTFDMNIQAINHSGQVINAQVNHQVFFQDGVFISDLITVTNIGPANGDPSAKPSSTPVDQLSSIFHTQLSNQLGSPMIPMISTTPAMPIPGASGTLAVPNNHLHPSYSPSGMSPVASMMGRSPPASGSISPRQLIKGPPQETPYLNHQPSYLSSQTPPPPSQSMPLSDMPSLQPLEPHGQQYQQYQQHQPQILINQQPLQQMQTSQMQTPLLATQMHQPSFQTLHMSAPSLHSQQISPQHQPSLPSLHQSMLQPQSVPLQAIPLALQPSSSSLPSIHSQHIPSHHQAQHPAPDQPAHLAPESQLSPEPNLLSTSHSSLQSHQQQQELYSLTSSQSELPLPFDFPSNPSYTNIPRLGDLRSSSSFNVFHSSSFSNLFATPSNPNIFASQFSSAPLTSSTDWATLGLATGPSFPLTASLTSFDPAPSSGGQSTSQ